MNENRSAGKLPMMSLSGRQCVDVLRYYQRCSQGAVELRLDTTVCSWRDMNDIIDLTAYVKDVFCLEDATAEQIEREVSAFAGMCTVVDLGDIVARHEVMAVDVQMASGMWDDIKCVEKILGAMSVDTSDEENNSGKIAGYEINVAKLILALICVCPNRVPPLRRKYHCVRRVIESASLLIGVICVMFALMSFVWELGYVGIALGLGLVGVAVYVLQVMLPGRGRNVLLGIRDQADVRRLIQECIDNSR